MLQLAKNLASEWGQYGIRVNTISPGYIVTAMVEELFRRYPERRTDWPTQNMLGKLSKPEDFRGAAVFLLSPASSYMTGADMRIGTYNLELTLPISIGTGSQEAPTPSYSSIFFLHKSKANSNICVDGGHVSW